VSTPESLQINKDMGDNVLLRGGVRAERVLTSTNTAGIVRAEESELRPGHMPMMGTYFTYLFFIPLDTPECTNIVTIDKASRLLLPTHAVR
jgi:hypothetical protein